MYIYRLLTILLVLVLGYSMEAKAQITIAGRITDEGDKKPIEFATILMKENGRWAITDKDGSFTIKDVPTGWATLTIQCLGYAKRELTMNITMDMPRLRITLKQENL